MDKIYIKDKLDDLKEEFDSIKDMSFEEYLSSKYVDVQLERNRREYWSKRCIKRDSIMYCIYSIIGIIIALLIPSLPDEFVTMWGKIIGGIICIGLLFMYIYNMLNGTFKSFLYIIDETEEYEEINNMFEEKHNKDNKNINKEDNNNEKQQ